MYGLNTCAKEALTYADTVYDILGETAMLVELLIPQSSVPVVLAEVQSFLAYVPERPPLA
jgi:hypothetical protein